MDKYAARNLSELKPGDHLCCIYETEEEHRALLTPFLRQGLERNEKVLYAVDARTPEMILDYLRKDGLAVEPFIKSGQLCFLSIEDAYLRGGAFDPDEMIRFLESETRRALEDGYSALRASGETTWALKGLPGSERLIEYEAKLNHFFPKSKCLALCQYDRRCFAPDKLLQIVHTHPLVIVGTEIFDNFYYVPADDFFAPDKGKKMFEQWLKNLSRHKKIREDLMAANQQLKTSGQQLQAANQQLRANEEQLRAEIAERRKAEERLREYTTRLSYLTKYANDSIILLDENFRFLETNERVSESYGYTREELAGMHARQFRAPQTRNDYERQINVAQETGKAVYETVHQRKDGTTFPVEISVRAIDVEGKRFYQAIIRDITGRKRMEEAQRVSEQNLNRAQAVAQVGSWILDVPKNVLTWSAETYRMFGVPQGQKLTLEAFAAFVHPQDVTRVLEAWDAALHGAPYDIEHRILVGGETRWVRERAEVSYDASGNALEGIGTVQDITERKKAEEQLRDYTLRLSYLTKYANDSIILLDKDFCFLETNERVSGFYGYSREELAGMSARQMRAPQTRNDFAGQVKLAQTAGRAIFETVHQRKDGTTFPVEISLCAIDVEGKRFYQAIIRDITERRRAEEVLKQSEEKVRCITDSARDAIVMMDPEGKINFWNPAAERVLLYTSGEAVGKNLHRFLSPARFQEAHSAAFPEFQRTGHGAAVGKTVELAAVRKDGVEIAVELSLSAIRREDGWHAVGIIRDITARKELGEELKKNLADLQQFRKVAIDRENRMIELKQEVNGLSKKLGGPPPYDLSFLK